MLRKTKVFCWVSLASVLAWGYTQNGFAKTNFCCTSDDEKLSTKKDLSGGETDAAVTATVEDSLWVTQVSPKDPDIASPEAAATPDTKSGKSYGKIGIGVKLSLLGAGIEAATPLTRKSNLRGGFNMFQYSSSFVNDGIHYGGQLNFRSVEAHYDWFPFGGFHLSPGMLLYNGNEVKANAAVPGGQTFTLGGTTYLSEPGSPVSGTGKLDFVKVSPTILAGFGNLIPRSGRHFSFLFDFGGAYQGSGRVNLNLLGNICDTTGLNCRNIATDPTAQANIQSQENKIKKDIEPYKFFPIISFGVGFNF